MTEPIPDRFDALYKRVSGDSQTTASQEPDLQRYERACDLPCLWFTDTFTGRTRHRPGFNELWDHALDRRVRNLVIWRMDRLGRTVPEISALFKELETLKVGLVSLRESFDLRTPSGLLMAHVLLSFAQYETELRGERVKAGIARAKAAGQVWGGGVKGRRWLLTEDKEAAVHTMKANGWSVTAIARALGLSRQTIYVVLRSEKKQAEDTYD